ncbi:MAG: helicase-related protein [Polyangiaceae bacterium]
MSFSPRVIEWRSPIRPAQAEAARALVRSQQGVIGMPTASGKTRALVLAASLTKQPTLSIVPTVEIANSFAEEIERSTGITPTFALGGSKELSFYTIATIETLDGDPGLLAEAAGFFGCVVRDEVHRSASASSMRVLNSLPAKFRFGASATLTRQDGLSAWIGHVFGRVVHRVTIGEVASTGHVLRPEYRTVETDYPYPYSGPDDWHGLLRDIAADDGRNATIADVVVREVAKGASVIILTGTKAHAATLRDLCASQGIAGEVLTSDVGKRARADIVDRARGGQLRAIFATSLADEGLDIPRLDTLVLAWPAKAEGKLLQRVGRIVRVHDGKRPPRVIDITDTNVGVLKYQAQQRRAAFERHWGSEGEHAA